MSFATNMTKHFIASSDVLARRGDSINAFALKASNNISSHNTSFSSEGERILTPTSDEYEDITMADAQGAVSAGALAQINEGIQVDNPVLQCVQIKPMASQQNQERYRVVMNDSVNFIQCMLAQRKYKTLLRTW